MGGKIENNKETYDLLGELKRGRAAPGSAAPGAEKKEDRAAGSVSIKAYPAKKRKKRKKSSFLSRFRLILLALIAIAAALFLIVTVARALGSLIFNRVSSSLEDSAAQSEAIEQETEDEEALALLKRADILDEARLFASQYDYESAIERLGDIEGFEEDAEAIALRDEFEETRSGLVEQDVTTIPHIFFHILCVDPATSFDESKWGTQADGYNSLMTTVDEFRAMLYQLYEGGYVLVALHDLAHEETGEDGTARMVRGSIMLPPGKKAIVMSEDDVCYYEYMEGAGFSDLMLVGDDGRPINRYTDASGTEHLGAYDVASILDEFIDEYPDFSYHGHKACLVFTGYNGVLGYRTDESYDPESEYYDPSLEQGHDVAAEREEAVKVLRALYEDGYELGSHSWGHRDLGSIEWDRFKKDCDRWERNVASLIREATGSQPDIIIYPRGADVGDWHPYSSDNERFNYLYQLGFRYFCNVDNSQYWVQVGDTYLRQGRRALDGYNLWMDVSGQKSRLGDLFSDLDAIFDPARPTPVPSY